MLSTPKTHAVPFLLVCLGVAIATGCTVSHPTLHESFGASVSGASQLQTAHPRASENLTPVAQMNGPAAKQSMDKYVKTFEPNAEQKSNAAQMFVGLGAAGGGSE